METMKQKAAAWDMLSERIAYLMQFPGNKHQVEPVKKMMDEYLKKSIQKVK